MSKRASFTTPSYVCGNSDTNRKKNLHLTTAQKVKLLEKLESGISAKHLSQEYDIAMYTIHKLKKQKDKLLMLQIEEAKVEDLDRLLKAWIRQRRSKHKPVPDLLIFEQARAYHEQLQIAGSGDYSADWLQKFKKRIGSKYFRSSVDKPAVHREKKLLVPSITYKEYCQSNTRLQDQIALFRRLSSQPDDEVVTFVRSVTSQVKELPRSACTRLSAQIERLIAAKSSAYSLGVDPKGPDPPEGEFEEIIIKNESEHQEFYIEIEPDIFD